MRFSRNRVYLTSCQNCGGTTSKSFAHQHGGYCKACATIGATNAGVEMKPQGPKCPDCGGPISAYNLRKGYHCDACTRAIEGPAYSYNETSYEGGY